MTDAADLLSAIAASPADDLPRMVFADWLDERGETAYAQFVRDQIRLAQVPAWDPLAVRARHQLKDSLGIGKPFFGTLPELPIFLKWHPEKAFRRGFGTGVIVHQLSGLLEAGQQLFDVAPVEELWLSAATLDQWRQFAKSPWLQNVRKLHLHFSQGLHEPIRCLTESKYAGNIDEIWFDTLATPAAGTVIEALAESPLAKQLQGLHMRLVHTPSLPEVIEALAVGKFMMMERFSMVQAGIGRQEVDDFSSMPFFDQLKTLDFSFNSIGNNLYPIYNSNLLECLFLNSIDMNYGELNYEEVFSQSLQVNNSIRILSLSDVSWSTGVYQHPYYFSPSNRCINVSQSGLGPSGMDNLIFSATWPLLREINLSRNYFSNITINKLCHMTIPSELTTIVFSDNQLSDKSTIQLESHFADRLVWASDDEATGLSQ